MVEQNGFMIGGLKLSKPPDPAALAKSGTEHGHQVAVFAWAAMHVGKYPELKWLHAVPNGGARGDDEKTRMIRGGQLAAEGVRVGVSDIALDVARGGYHGLKIEMKKIFKLGNPGINYCSKEQVDYINFCQAEGYAAGACQGWEQAVSTLEWYLNLGPYKA